MTKEKDSNKDHLFGVKISNIGHFEFNQEVAKVFDDMVSRSVPFYREVHGVLQDILPYLPKHHLHAYDLGCSTGTTLKILHRALPDYHLTGVDASDPMLRECKKKFCQEQRTSIELVCDSIENLTLKESDLVVMNYTLQFIEREKRFPILKQIYKCLAPGGFFFFSEKIKSNHPFFQDLTTDLYYAFKSRNGYSELEISQKREALEDVLCPLSPEENLQLLSDAQFEGAMLFRWYNFAVFLGRRPL